MTNDILTVIQLVAIFIYLSIIIKAIMDMRRHDKEFRESMRVMEELAETYRRNINRLQLKIIKHNSENNSVN